MSSENKMPHITVIVATFNGASTLARCLDSFVSQTYQHKSIVVIDGGSTDGTIDIIKEYNDTIDYWITEPDTGIYNAWNKGLSKAHGQWICFLGADDFFWTSDTMQKIGEKLAVMPASIRVTYGQIVLVNAKDEIIYTVGGRSWDDLKKKFKNLMNIPHPGTMHHRSLFELHGYFDESFRIAGDYEFLLRELITGDAFFMSEIIVAAMQIGGISNDTKNTLIQLREVRRAQKKHGLALPGSDWVLAMTKVYVRLILWRLLGETLTRKVLDYGRYLMGHPPFWTKN